MDDMHVEEVDDVPVIKLGSSRGSPAPPGWAMLLTDPEYGKFYESTRKIRGKLFDPGISLVYAHIYIYRTCKKNFCKSRTCKYMPVYVL